MLRTFLAHKHALRRSLLAKPSQILGVNRPAMVVRTAPLAHQAVCEFSTSKASRHAPKHKSDTKSKDNDASSTVATTTNKRTSLTGHDPWDDFFYNRGFDDWIARDPFFARDPLFASIFKAPDEAFEQMRQRLMMPVLRSPPLTRTDTPTTTSTSRLVRASPGYEIKESDGTYEIALDIPQGLDTKHLKVELEHDGTIVHVSGERKEHTDNVDSVTRFSKRFTIGDAVDTEQLQANFADGCLVIRAPKKVVAHDRAKRQIAITNKPHVEMTDEELRHKNYSDAFDESDWAEVGKKAA